MEILLAIGVILAVVFSFSLAIYLTAYKFNMSGIFSKVVAVAFSGGVLFVATMALAIMAVWPPYWPM